MASHLFVKPPLTWTYRSSVVDGKRGFEVFDGVDPEPICFVVDESNARGLIESGNSCGYPDVTYFAADINGRARTKR